MKIRFCILTLRDYIFKNNNEIKCLKVICSSDFVKIYIKCYRINNMEFGNPQTLSNFYTIIFMLCNKIRLFISLNNGTIMLIFSLLS